MSSNQIPEFRDEIDKAAKRSKDDFFTWFNAAPNAEKSFIGGSWDFNFHIATPIVNQIKTPESKVCLEIGHGGGRLLNAAARNFGLAIGVDIHGNNNLVKQELSKRGLENFELYVSDGETIPVPEVSVDLVYSFIVLQHVGRIQTFYSYLKESYRILKPGGLGLFYFGRKARWSVMTSSKPLFWMECLLENLWLRKGYLELPAEVNHTNLLITRRYAKNLAQSVGFRFLGFAVSHKQVPDGYGLYGGQHGILVGKPA